MYHFDAHITRTKDLVFHLDTNALAKPQRFSPLLELGIWYTLLECVNNVERHDRKYVVAHSSIPTFRDCILRTFNWLYPHCEVYKMATNKSKPKNDYVMPEFVNYTLSADEKRHVQAGLTGGKVKVDALLADLASNGYKLSLSYKADKDAFNCAATQQVDGHVHKGYCFSSFAGTPTEAIAFTHFKVFTVFAGKVASEVDFDEMG